MSNSKFYIYTLSSPENVDVVKYVGYTNNINRRYNQHKNSYKYGFSKVKCWIKSLNKKGLLPIINIIDEYDTIEEVLQAEIRYIALYKSVGANLKNHTLGGEGCLGIKRSEETKRKISEAHKGKLKISLNFDKELFIEYYNRGESVKNMISIFNVCQQTILKAVKEYGLQRPKFIKDFITKDILYKYYIEDNMTKKEISIITGITERNLKKRLKDWKIYKSEKQRKELYLKINKSSVSEEMQVQIKEDRENKIKLKDIAKKYNITISTISNLIYKK